MNKRPIHYLQNNPAWKNNPYRVPGESSTIGSAGCGPTCAAMVISTLTNVKFEPPDACHWSIRHGYKALKQGTYYSYFKPQLAAYNIACEQLPGGPAYGNPNHPNHAKVRQLLKEGYYIIALMNKGLWTSSGHFVLVWWSGNKVYINDPASMEVERLEGDPNLFFRQAKYYWSVDARDYNKEDDRMTGSEILKELTDEQAFELVTKAMRHAGTLPEPTWSKNEGFFAEAETKGVINGGRPECFVKRDELAAILGRNDLL